MLPMMEPMSMSMPMSAQAAQAAPEDCPVAPVGEECAVNASGEGCDIVASVEGATDPESGARQVA
jgi:hypothetical protein